MKNIRTVLCLIACALGVSIATTALAEPTATVEMKLVPEKAVHDLTHSYLPLKLTLQESAPAELKKKPEMKAPLYGQIKFGGKNYLLALDEPQDKPAKLYVDANGNGDLTDDPPTQWKPQVSEGHLMYIGSIKLPLSDGDRMVMVNLVAARPDPHDPTRAEMSHALLYYADYAYDGQIKLGDVSYHAVLTNDPANGDFRGEFKDMPAAGGRLLIDVNHDGQFDSHSETFDPRAPFNIKGTTWRIADMTAAGHFKIEKSDQNVPEIPLLVKGEKALPFTATMMDGKEVKFPGDYKGKIVLLDFWATWCEACMQEMPGVVKTYNQFHPKGLEILGISLDKADRAEQVRLVSGQQGMTWPQVYEGKWWEARLARMYLIDAIPHPFLVDGDTGKILAEGDELLGDGLPASVQKALEQKAKNVKK